MKRRREVRAAVSRASNAGSMSAEFLERMTGVPFVMGEGERTGRSGDQESSSISSRSSVVGMSAAGSTNDASGAQ
jgi:hypothetical protein